jgi:hypothetical protein
VAAGETGKLPLGVPPVEKPVPTHVLAFVLDQARLLVSPAAMVVGVAVSCAVTLPPTLIVTLAGVLIAPPAPTHVRLYVDVTVGVTVTVPPATARGPFQLASSRLVATQVVALLLPHVRSLDPPRAIDVKVAPSVALTDCPTVIVTLAGALVAAPAPVQVSE